MSVTPQMLLVQFFCASLLVYGLAIPTVFYGFQDEDHPCQSDRGDVSLSTWLKVTALTSFAVSGFHLVVLLFVSMVKGMKPFLISLPILFALETFFWIGWWGYGIAVVVYNKECVHQGVDMAVMAIVQLAIGGLRFAYSSVPMAVVMGGVDL